MPQLENHMKRSQVIIQKLRDNGHKITPQRLAIAKVLAKSKGHPSVENIHHQLKKDFPTMSLATIYKNILLINSLGEVLELGFPDGQTDMMEKSLIPIDTSSVSSAKEFVDLDLDSLDAMQKEVALETNFEILNRRLDFFGICSNCMVEKV